MISLMRRLFCAGFGLIVDWHCLRHPPVFPREVEKGRNYSCLIFLNGLQAAIFLMLKWLILGWHSLNLFTHSRMLF